MADTRDGESVIDELAHQLQADLGDGYIVDRPLGSGGFAVVFLVRDLLLKRSLAVKVLLPAIASTTTVERFRREGEAIAGLSHPNIVPLHFVGGRDDLVYLAMACVDGGSLADRLSRETRLPIADTTRILSEVASALAHAHKRGIIHRDIKPHNVLLDAESGRALLTDFGIARVSDATSITSSGMVVGTPAYLAPEQVTGDPIDHRADLYALGIMAYEMLAGRQPFDAPTAAGTIMKRLGGPPPPVTQLRAEVPQWLQKVIDGCLATDPADRYQSAADIVRALGGQTPSSGEQRTSGSRTTARSAWLRVGALLLGVGSIALMMKAAPSRDGAQPMLAPMDSGMVFIPAGEYLVGHDSGPDNASFRPAHRVALRAFGIDKHEVTVGAYKMYVDSMNAPAPWRGDSIPSLDLPITGMPFQDAADYCRWRHPDGGRLPTEEEWEAAARGKEGRRFPWGNEVARARANVPSSGRSFLAPGSAFASGATPEGIHDLIGNAWEWTSSSFRPYPNGPSIPDTMLAYRVIRGGAFNTLESIATSWWRQPVPPAATPAQLDKTGFRCAMNERRGPGVSNKR
jgi:formylglycine-generating enzyme required for sulfatase activity/tRNA A-37 threonylcarbamoyl transferase component Bud32